MNIKSIILFVLIFTSFSSFISAQNNTSLIDLIKNEEYETAKKLITNKTNLDEQDSRNATPFMWAIYKNQLDIVKLLKNNDANVNIKGIISDNKNALSIGSPLTVAALKGNLEMVKFLVQNCDISANDKELDSYGDEAWNALFYLAYRKDFKQIADFLIKKGAEVDLEDEGERTPLFYACSQGNTEYANYLISKGADANTTDYNATSPASHAIFSNQSETAKIILKNQKKLINHDKRSLSNPLVAAIIQEDEDMIKWLIENGADKTIASKFTVTIFEEAHDKEKYGAHKLLSKYILDGKLINKDLTLSSDIDLIISKTHKPEFFKMLLNNGAKIDNDGGSFYPATTSYLGYTNSKIRILEENDFKINKNKLTYKFVENTIKPKKFNLKVFNHILEYITNNTSTSHELLETAIEQNNILAFDLLMTKEIDLNTELSGNSSFLWKAYKKNNLYMFKTLIEKGVDLDFKYDDNKTILHRIVTNKDCKQLPFLKMVLDSGGNPNIKDNKGNTPLHIAKSSCKVQLLMANNADISLKNKNGESISKDAIFSQRYYDYAQDKEHLSDLLLTKIEHYLSNRPEQLFDINYILNAGINLKDKKNVEKINDSIISLAKTSVHFNRFNRLISILKGHDKNYTAPNLDNILIDKILKSLDIPNDLVASVKQNNLSEFKNLLKKYGKDDPKHYKERYRILLTVAAQFNSNDIINYILDLGIYSLYSNILPFPHPSRNYVNVLQILVDKKNLKAIDRSLEMEDYTSSATILKNYIILCDLKDDERVKKYLNKHIEVVKKSYSRRGNDIRDLNFAAVKNNLFGIVEYLSELGLDVSRSFNFLNRGYNDLTSTIIIENKIEFIDYYLKRCKKDDLRRLIEYKMEFIIQTKKNNIIDAFAPYIINNKELLSDYYYDCITYNNRYAMDVMLKLHDKKNTKSLKTYLKRAIETRNYNFIESYYKNGFDMSVKFQTAENGYGDDQGLIEYAIYRDKADMINFLIECEVKTESKNIANNDDSPIDYASKTYNLGLVKSILNTGLNPNIIYKNYNQPWTHLYLDRGFYSGFEAFWKKGVNPNLKDESSNNLLHHMIYNDYDFTINAPDILDKISNINAKNSTGDTALFMACKSGNIKVINALLSKNADVNIGNNNKITPLMMAAYTNNTVLIKILIKAKANIKTEDYRGRNALDYANMGNANDVIDLLK